ncbi:MAG: MoaD/ThiS family protein [Spirochaetaceae bacterium]|nr:MAG: MoaD/ThiS family protein [Spirochaetaceae bacterium]
MQVNVKAMGQMKHFLGEGSREVELPEEATVEDFLRFVHENWRGCFPAYLWNAKQRRFRGPVIIMVDRKVVRAPGTRLSDHCEIELHKVVVGG